MSGFEHLSAAYREEAAELLVELEASLLELEERPDDAELIARAFRAMHTIKGSGAMFGFTDIASFTHELETVFDLVRAGKIPVTPGLVDVALRSKDFIRDLLAGTAPAAAPEREALLGALRAFLPSGAPATPGAPAAASPSATPAPAAGVSTAPVAAPDEQTFRVRFRPRRELFRNGTNPLALLAELDGVGRCELMGHVDAVPALEELDPEDCHLAWDAIVTTGRDLNALRDVFVFVEDLCELRIEVVDDGRAAAPPEYKRLGELLVERQDVTAEQLEEALAAQKRIGDLLEERHLVSDSVVQAAAAEQRVVRSERARRDAVGAASGGDGGSSIRVGANKLDQLVDLVGELVIAQARLARLAGGIDEPQLVAVSEEIERLSAELRDNTLNIRMVPIGTTFARFKRLTRDLQGELGKQIELVTEGAETELDKTVIERLADPLVHLIRNSCDHGIEAAAVRTAAGKPATGTVKLSAYHSGPNVFIELRDDGAGLDLEAVRRKAVERGLLAPDAALTEKELVGLIFAPGLSTARSVSSVSGRGVGMDVVKRAIEALRGSIDVQTRKGAGTTIRIKLPLTLAIIEGLLVAVGDATYVLPMSLVEECVELVRKDDDARGSRLAPVRGELVPYVRLREWFDDEGVPPPIEQIAIASVEGQRYGFVVDHVVGQHQTVIKPLGVMNRHAKGVSGATILGDGTVALIVDVPALVHDVILAARTSGAASAPVIPIAGAAATEAMT
jgi:two-component system chemotaxis sensor kinase CheA